MKMKVKVFGCINDHKFTVRGTGSLDPETGNANIQLVYSNSPQHWHVFNYSDPLVLLTGYKEVDGGMNFLSLAKGGYSAVSTIDFGAGLMLRKTATIRWEGSLVMADYDIFGGARAADIESIEPYEEYMHPAGDGSMIAVGLARWRAAGGTLIEALVSTRYTFTEPKEVLKVSQVRRFTVTPSVSADGLVYDGVYATTVTAL